MNRTRLLAIGCLVLTGCVAETVRPKQSEGEFMKPGALLEKEIDQRIANIPFQHGVELYSNLVRLSQVGEPAIPSLLEQLSNPDPSIRSSCVYVLGVIDDKRTIPSMNPLLEDQEEIVRLEAAASLLGMGEWRAIPILIKGLESSDQMLRYKSFEALNKFTGLSFRYDFRGESAERSAAVDQWNEWWASKRGDKLLATPHE